MRLRALTIAVLVSVSVHSVFAWLSADQAGSPSTVLGAGPTTPQQDDALEISAFAVNLGNLGTGSTAIVDIAITRWSTTEERAHLISAVLERGPLALLTALHTTPSVGRFRIPGAVGPDPHQLRLGHDVHYAWQSLQPDGTRHIVVLTNRGARRQPATDQPPAVDNPFTAIEIRADANGDGEGKITIANRIAVDQAANTVSLQDYSSETMRLQRVSVRSR